MTHSLSDHEVQLVILVEQLTIQRGVPVSPSSNIEQTFRPIGISATGIAVLIEKCCYAAILARRKLVEAIDLDDVAALRQL